MADLLSNQLLGVCSCKCFNLLKTAETNKTLLVAIVFRFGNSLVAVRVNRAGESVTRTFLSDNRERHFYVNLRNGKPERRFGAYAAI